MPDNQTQTPLVSIVVNNYNYARFLRQAVQSALNQTYSNKEVIVVDDGSTDESRAVIESFGSQIKAIFQKNGGQGSAYNTGFAASRGDLIHYLDADDLLLPDAIETAVSLWEPGVSKVHFFLQVIEGNEGHVTDACVPSGRLSTGNVIPELVKSGNYNSPPATGNLYARQTLASILPMPPENWTSHSDLYCIFKAPFFGEIRTIDRPLGFYRVHGNNIDAQTQVSGKLLRYRLTKEEKRDKLLSECCRLRGIEYQVGTVGKSVANLKLRFSSSVLDSVQHPYPNEGKYSLFCRLMKACWTDNSASFAKKSLFSAWALALLLSWGPIQTRLLTLGFAPIARPRFIQHLLSFAAVRTGESPLPLDTKLAAR